jgi:hypothetical protein
MRLADIRKGVYTNAAVELATIMNSSAFAIWSTVLFLTLFMIWLVCAAGTFQGIIAGRLFGLENGWRGRSEASSVERRSEGFGNGDVHQ